MDIHQDDDQVTLGEVLDLASMGVLRVRAFGECRFWGEGLVWGEINWDPVDMLEQVIDEGLMRVYSDENGLFVGPSNPARVGG